MPTLRPFLQLPLMFHLYSIAALLLLQLMIHWLSKLKLYSHRVLQVPLILRLIWVLVPPLLNLLQSAIYWLPDMKRFLSISSSAAGPSQPTFDLNASTSVAESIVVGNISAGHERFQFLSTLLGPSQPTFDSSASTSAAQFITADDALADEILRFLSTLSGPADPSQPTFDWVPVPLLLNLRWLTIHWPPDTRRRSVYSPFQVLPNPSLTWMPVPLLANWVRTVDDTLTTEYEMLHILSTWSGPADPSQCTFDLGAGTFATESTTVDNTWVTGYEASQLLALPGPAEPIFNLDAGTSAVDDDDELTAKLKALPSPSASSGGTNQFTPPKNGDESIIETNTRKQVDIVSIDSERAYLISFWAR